MRQLILGEDNPASFPHYSNRYAYRGLIPREKAIEALGQDRAENAYIHASPLRLASPPNLPSNSV